MGAQSLGLGLVLERPQRRQQRVADQPNTLVTIHTKPVMEARTMLRCRWLGLSRDVEALEEPQERGGAWVLEALATFSEPRGPATH